MRFEVVNDPRDFTVEPYSEGIAVECPSCSDCIVSEFGISIKELLALAENHTCSEDN